VFVLVKENLNVWLYLFLKIQVTLAYNSTINGESFPPCFYCSLHLWYVRYSWCFDWTFFVV